MVVGLVACQAFFVTVSEAAPFGERGVARAFCRVPVVVIQQQRACHPPSLAGEFVQAPILVSQPGRGGSGQSEV
jgi:hypothetical protein